MKNLNYILFYVALVLACLAVLSAPTAEDYTMHTSDTAMNNVLMLLILAVLCIAGAIVLSLSDESGRTKQQL
jgi:hypothetical protein